MEYYIIILVIKSQIRITSPGFIVEQYPLYSSLCLATNQHEQRGGSG